MIALRTAAVFTVLVLWLVICGSAMIFVIAQAGQGNLRALIGIPPLLFTGTLFVAWFVPATDDWARGVGKWYHS